jgi:hypothetical protein
MARIFPRWQKHIAESIPGAQLVIIPNAGHVPHLGLPEIFYKELPLSGTLLLLLGEEVQNGVEIGRDDTQVIAAGHFYVDDVRAGFFACTPSCAIA